MAKNIAIISTDHHLSESNAALVKKLLLEELEVAKSNQITTHIWLGDVFDNRVAQREECLTTLNSVLEKYDKKGHEVICIPGNHDKTSYKSRTSFLVPFKYHPSFTLIEEITEMKIAGISCYFLPFFTDDLILDSLKSITDSRMKPVLFGHFAVTGSKNANGTIVESKLKQSDFDMFKRVYLGHYHDYQRVCPNIFHLGSLQQNNFGEDEKKGFWLFDADLNTTFIKNKRGQTFRKLTLDLDEKSEHSIEIAIKAFKRENPFSRLRVEVWGKPESVSAFDGVEFQKLGIDIKKKNKSIEVTNDYYHACIKVLDKPAIEEKFTEFCEKNEYKEEEGKPILKRLMYGEEEEIN